MHLYKQKKHLSMKGTILMVVLFVAFLLYFNYAFGNVSNDVSNQQTSALVKSINSAVIECYAIEGSYPPSIQYLEEHYGITYDHNKYEILYEPSGSNIRPSVSIFTIKEEK